MNSENKPFIANFFIPIANSIDLKLNEYDEIKQISPHNLEDIKNQTHTSTASTPNKDMDSDSDRNVLEI